MSLKVDPSAPLVPLLKPLAIVPGNHVSEEPVTLCIKEKFLSMLGEDFQILNAATGQPALQVRGPKVTLHDRKSFYSADGEQLLFMVRYHHAADPPYFNGVRLDVVDPTAIPKNPHADPHPTVFVAEKASGKLISSLLKNPKLTRSVPCCPLCPDMATEDERPDEGITMTAQVGIPDPETGKTTPGPRLGLHGPFDALHGAPIVDMATGQPVAIIKRTVDDAFGKVAQSLEPETYFVTVAPGMDYALVAGIAICFDEIHNERPHRHIMQNLDANRLAQVGQAV